MADDIMLYGPLGQMAGELSVRSGVAAADLYVGAVCWWSAAVAPAARIQFGLLEERILVWAALVGPTGDVVLPAVLAEGFARIIEGLTVLSPYTVRTAASVSAVVRRAARGQRSGRGAGAVLLTGSPVGGTTRARRLSPYLEGPLRQGWDGETGWSDPEGRTRNDRQAVLGVLWELDQRAWWDLVGSTYSPTYSRMLHFRAAEPERGHVAGPVSPSGSWPQALAKAYHQVFQEQPGVQLDYAAATKLFAVRGAAEVFDDVLSEELSAFYVRLGDHTRRIAAVLALAEGRTVVRGPDVVAAWSLVRRAGLDITALLNVQHVRSLFGELDANVRAASGSTELIPARPDRAADDVAAPLDQMPTGRSEAVVSLVKRWYRDQCQICRTVLSVPGTRGRISHGAHIRPFGGSHQGPDRAENMLCLCPNCHARFDGGGLYLTDDLHVFDAVTAQDVGVLDVHPWHRIDRGSLAYHRSLWTRPVR